MKIINYYEEMAKRFIKPNMTVGLVYSSPIPELKYVVAPKQILIINNEVKKK